jgi:hypothetical protein
MARAPGNNKRQRRRVSPTPRREVATISELRRRAKRRIASLSPDRLRVALDFLAYLEERESQVATDELLGISGFVEELNAAEKEAARAGWVDWRKVRRDV